MSEKSNSFQQPGQLSSLGIGNIPLLMMARWYGWYLEDRPFTIDRAYVRQVFIDVSDPRSRFFEIMKRQTMPPDAMFARRMEALTLAVLGQLGATANWHRIAREWLYGDEPATPLGEAEAAFFRPAPELA